MQLIRFTLVMIDGIWRGDVGVDFSLSVADRNMRFRIHRNNTDDSAKRQ